MNENQVMRLWRRAGLPEYFLGNGGTNLRLCEFARLVTEAERDEWRRRLLDQAAHMRENAAALAKWPGSEQEARARELAASYVHELVTLDRAESVVNSLRPNAEVTGNARR